MAQVYSVSQIRDTLKKMPLDRRIRKLVLFGSHAKGTAQIQSDLDFFLDSGKEIVGLPYFDLKGKLEEAFQREIDLIPDVDVIPGSRIEQEIRTYGVTVYGG